MTDQQTINNFNAYSIPICSQQPKGKKKKKKKKNQQEQQQQKIALAVKYLQFGLLSTAR
jgi:Tfp pilus assembly protein PilF